MTCSEVPDERLGDLSPTPPSYRAVVNIQDELATPEEQRPTRVQDTRREVKLLGRRLQQLPEPSVVRRLFVRQGCRYVERAMARRLNRLKPLARTHKNTAPREEATVDVWAENVNISCQIGLPSLLDAGTTPHEETRHGFFFCTCL